MIYRIVCKVWNHLYSPMIVVFSSQKNLDHNENFIQNNLKRSPGWCNLWGFKILDKTVAVNFFRIETLMTSISP